MIKDKDSVVKEITYSAIGIALLISGGFIIYQMSFVLPIPGIKYILMSPYLAIVIYILLMKIENPYTLIKFGSVFGLIMTMMNFYMGLSIVITSILSQLTILFLGKKHKPFYGAVLFSTYTGISALLVSKYMIGGIFSKLTISWVMVTGFICMVFGVFGTLFAKKILKHLVKNTY